jgi:hypothetical protein
MAKRRVYKKKRVRLSVLRMRTCPHRWVVVDGVMICVNCKKEVAL